MADQNNAAHQNENNNADASTETSDAQTLYGDDNATDTDNAGASTKSDDDKSTDDSGEDKAEEKDDASKEQGDKDDSASDDTEQKKEGEEADEDKSDEDGKGAPEEYGEFTVPDGFELNEELMAEFTPLAKALNASQEDAQKLIDMCSQTVQAALDEVYKPYYEAEAARKEIFAKDPEIGGDKKEEALSLALKTVKAFGTEQTSAEFDETGLGNSPELIRMLSRIGKKLSDDKEVFSSAGGDSGELSDAELLYGGK